MLPSSAGLNTSEKISRLFIAKPLDRCFGFLRGENCRHLPVPKKWPRGYSWDNTVLIILRWWAACRSLLPVIIMSVCNRSCLSFFHHWSNSRFFPARRLFHTSIIMIRICSRGFKPKLFPLAGVLIPCYRYPYLICLSLQSFKELLFHPKVASSPVPGCPEPSPSGSGPADSLFH